MAPQDVLCPIIIYSTSVFSFAINIFHNNKINSKTQIRGLKNSHLAVSSNIVKVIYPSMKKPPVCRESHLPIHNLCIICLNSCHQKVTNSSNLLVGMDRPKV